MRSRLKCRIPRTFSLLHRWRANDLRCASRASGRTSNIYCVCIIYDVHVYARTVYIVGHTMCFSLLHRWRANDLRCASRARGRTSNILSCHVRAAYVEYILCMYNIRRTRVYARSLAIRCASRARGRTSNILSCHVRAYVES